ncbi:hypothetical protein LSTR_LSTR010780 [Laodelphax striatellus]|uniref:FCP1 homology domain-containing protein n=1 Tax=Laodelphax striatellus TaxID=195883 RepID=A0A482XDZ6_LAOST|nr:hypothetical protein LSTR_LSTR010780 [Laodelphax striatellus]
MLLYFISVVMYFVDLVSSAVDCFFYYLFLLVCVSVAWFISLSVFQPERLLVFGELWPTVYKIVQHQPVKYELYPLSPLSRHRLNIVKRKVLVLDLDETLIHSHNEGIMRQAVSVRPQPPADFVLKVTIDRHPVRFFVHKRPHVDFFLDIVRISLLFHDRIL